MFSPRAGVLIRKAISSESPVEFDKPKFPCDARHLVRLRRDWNALNAEPSFRQVSTGANIGSWESRQ